MRKKWAWMRNEKRGVNRKYFINIIFCLKDDALESSAFI